MGTPDPKPISHAIDIDKTIADVDERELVTYALQRRLLEQKKQQKLQEVNGPQAGETGGHSEVTGQQQPRALTLEEVAKLERFVHFEEDQKFRVQSKTVAITTHISGEPKTEQIELSTLPQSYTLIRNLVWIDKNPVYQKALAEWEAQENIFASRVARKSKRGGDFRNEIYNMIGYYSVFQGVLLTATSQSNYLHCLNVGLPIALSAFASVGTLVHINRKFKAIGGLERTISKEQIYLKAVKEKIEALKRKGEAFRFFDLENEKTPGKIEGSSQPKRFNFFGLTTSWIVPLAIVLFSVLFVIAHPLILCRPGPK